MSSSQGKQQQKQFPSFFAKGEWSHGTPSLSRPLHLDVLFYFSNLLSQCLKYNHSHKRDKEGRELGNSERGCGGGARGGREAQSSTLPSPG